MLGPVSRVRKTNIGLRHLFYSSTPDLQILKQKTLSERNTHTPLTSRTPIRGNETNSELTTSDDEMLARRHGE